MIASVLTEVTVTVAALEEVEPATDDESDAWEEHRTDRERRTSKEANAIIQTSVKSRLENNSMRSGGESQCRAAAGTKRRTEVIYASYLQETDNARGRALDPTNKDRM